MLYVLFKGVSIFSLYTTQYTASNLYYPYRCVPECLMRLSDTRGEIRAAYSALLEVVPTHIMTR